MEVSSPYAPNHETNTMDKLYDHKLVSVGSLDVNNIIGNSAFAQRRTAAGWVRTD